MLNYYSIYVFVVGIFALEQKILGPDLKSFQFSINSTNPTNSAQNLSLLSEQLRKISNHQFLMNHSYINSLVSELLNVNPKKIGNIVSLLNDLAKQADAEINKLNELLAAANKDEKRKRDADTKAKIKLDKLVEQKKKAEELKKQPSLL
eukprot:TRINITY_DN172_c0_g1_i4.p1 TRINITY_DN172_c0_g1~~TRINITY_DN172_c0_g1_i4.p1  ORF type:complete len:149 (-),score=26.03 TRINITY_DN172_c0_g1_i4:680-1126(-)